MRGRWPLPEGGKLRRSLPAPYLRPPPKKCGAGAHAAPLAPLFWADLHAIASGAPRRGAVIALFGEAVRDPTDGPLCERWAAEAQLSPVCARRREMPTSSRLAHSLPERLRVELGAFRGVYATLPAGVRRLSAARRPERPDVGTPRVKGDHNFSAVFFDLTKTAVILGACLRGS